MNKNVSLRLRQLETHAHVQPSSCIRTPRSLRDHALSISRHGRLDFCAYPKDAGTPVTRPWGRTPVSAVVDGVSWDTSVWRDTKTNGALLAVPIRIRGSKGSGETVTVEFTFDPEDD